MGSKDQKGWKQREKSGNGIQLNWPEEATAAKIVGLVTNSASMLIAIQSAYFVGRED